MLLFIVYILSQTQWNILSIKIRNKKKKQKLIIKETHKQSKNIFFIINFNIINK